ncbi:hypothetical protein GCM10011289_01900 [Paludibacterium paludis]|uniref:Uncharacterized protein n=1 Tax=Paludibacterium paludis TaxID=1225769 RepID=A0A918U6X6_9NEIS|nr:hypothetical protein GCM10011289_01900 [Paludibacterium paludis]
MIMGLLVMVMLVIVIMVVAMGIMLVVFMTAATACGRFHGLMASPLPILAKGLFVRMMCMTGHRSSPDSGSCRLFQTLELL